MIIINQVEWKRDKYIGQYNYKFPFLQVSLMKQTTAQWLLIPISWIMITMAWVMNVMITMMVIVCPETIVIHNLDHFKPFWIFQFVQNAVFYE